MKDLMELFMHLTLDRRQDIIGGMPSADTSFIDSRAVSELLSSLADNAADRLSFLMDRTAPDFDAKLVFNGLTDPINGKLRVLSYQVPMVDDFLDSRDPGLRQAIAQEIREYYKQSKTAIADDVENAPNQRYVWLVERLLPADLKHPHSRGAYRAAAELVIAKYFETCDAYDNPTSATPA